MIFNRSAAPLLLLLTCTSSFVPSYRPSFHSIKYNPLSLSESAAEDQVAEVPVDAVDEVPEIVVEEPVGEVAAEETSEAGEADDEAEDDAEKSRVPIPVDYEGFKIYIGNLGYDKDKPQVEEMFQPYGSVMSCFVPRDRNTGNPRGFAFVEMVNEEEGQAAIAALDGADIDGRTIKVNKQVSKDELAKTRKPREERPVVEGKRIYVGNLPFDIERHELVSMFEDYGTVLESFLPFDKESGKPRGFAFVTMADAEADAAIEALNYCTFGGRTLNVNESLPRGQPAEPKPIGKRTKIYVGNLNFATREQDIVSVFAEYGQILDCFFPTDRETGQYRGFCFVTMSEDAAQKAIEGVDGVELDGRLLRVNEALPKNQPGASAPSDDFEADAGGSYEDSADYES